jgi:hypothetical protein
VQKRAYFGHRRPPYSERLVQPAAQAGTGAMLKLKATLEDLFELDLRYCLHSYGKTLLSCKGPAVAPRRKTSVLSPVS